MSAGDRDDSDKPDRPAPTAETERPATDPTAEIERPATDPTAEHAAVDEAALEEPAKKSRRPSHRPRTASRVALRRRSQKIAAVAPPTEATETSSPEAPPAETQHAAARAPRTRRPRTRPSDEYPVVTPLVEEAPPTPMAAAAPVSTAEPAPAPAAEPVTAAAPTTVKPAPAPVTAVAPPPASAPGTAAAPAAVSPPARATTARPAETSASSPPASAMSATVPLSGSFFSPTAGAETYGDDFLLDDETIGVRLNRRWVRAKIDLFELGGELSTHYWRLDLVVIFAALSIAAGAAIIHRALVTPDTIEVKEQGLTFRRTLAWLAPESLPPEPPRLLHDTVPLRRKEGELPYQVVYTSALEPDARLEVLVDHRPPWSNILTGLELDRRTRWGELYHADPGRVRSIAGHDWLRTSYRYAFTPEKGDEPRIDHAVEYATVDRERLYAVTFRGTPEQIERMEETVASSLRVESHTGMPLLPQVGRLASRGHSRAVARIFPSTVMVVVADMIDGRLRARGGGSGIIVGSDGSVITNYHVLHDKNGRLHDLFIIGRHVGDGRAPELVCAGHSNRSKLQPDLDLALVKCDLDLDGRPWVPGTAGDKWPPVTIGEHADVEPGQRLWVIGYPDVGGGGITLSQGLVEGWTGEAGGLGRDYLKTDASITHGNSGGPVVDDEGRLVGIATAFRIRINASGGMVETAKVGLVRPIAATAELLAIARAGWQPREGHTAVSLEPTAIEAPPEGIHVSTQIVDADNRQPIAGALLMVLRPGVATKDIDMNRLDDLVLAWGRSNADGEIHVKQPVPVPGTYSVLVMARGYEPLVADSELRLAEDAPPFYDPWSSIPLRRQ